MDYYGFLAFKRFQIFNTFIRFYSKKIDILLKGIFRISFLQWKISIKHFLEETLRQLSDIVL